MVDVKLGFIGAGQMATALADGLLRAGLISKDRLMAADISREAQERFSTRDGGDGFWKTDRPVRAGGRRFFGRQTASNRRGGRFAWGKNRPRQADYLDCRRGDVGPIGRGVRAQAKLIRVMPNTPCLVGEGAGAYSAALR